MPIANVLSNLAHKSAAIKNGYRPTAQKFSVQTPHCARGVAPSSTTATSRVSFITPRPCPHCGGRHVELIDTNHPKYQLLCLYCGTMGPESVRPSGAIYAWNLLPRAS